MAGPAPGVATQPRSTGRSSLRSAPISRPLPPVSAFARRRLIGWLAVACLGLVALPALVTFAIFARSHRAHERVVAMAAGNPQEQENLESALLDDWSTVSSAVQAVADDPAMPDDLRRRCLEMLMIRSTNDPLALRTARTRELRVAYNLGTFFTQEAAQDRILDNWPDYEAAAHDLARDRGLPDCVRLRCLEMIEVMSEKPAAVALANYSRAMRCYRVAGRIRNPGAAKDEEAALIFDDPNQYQSPDTRFAPGTTETILIHRALDLFTLARDQYYEIADETSGNQKVSAEERGQRCERLTLGIKRVWPMATTTPYDEYMKERKAAYEAHKRREEEQRKKAAPVESNPSSPTPSPAP